MRSFVRITVLSALLCAFFSPVQPASAEPLHDSLVGSVNAYRASRGLPTLTASRTLQAAAQFMADDTAIHGIPNPPHVSSDGRNARQRLADAGYPVDPTWTGEIIAWGAPTSGGALSLWLNSPSHAAALNDGHYVAGGFGVACYGFNPCVWIVTLGSLVDAPFGSPSAPPAPPAPVRVAPTYHAAFAAQSSWPTASPGQVVQWVIAFTNTGNTAWSVPGANALRLGTGHPLDVPSSLASGSWIAANRPAQQTTSYVAPGQQAWFIVELVAPMTPGTYRLYVRPVIDGVTWLEDAGAYVDLVVR
jgi:hypothetical protein